MKWIVAALLIWAVWKLLRPKVPYRRRPAADPALAARRDAAAVLGVAADADEAAVRAAHRRLLTGVHPDRGGSDELTRRVNAARDVLLGDR